MKDKNRIETNYYSNGNKWYETLYVNNQRHGLLILWYDNGNKRSETPHVNGKRHGSRIHFNY